jgi:hypothetical protein
MLIVSGDAGFTQEPQRVCRAPARIVAAVHHMVGAVIVDGEFYAFHVRRHGIAVHALDIGARFLRQFRFLAILVHSPGLVWQRAAGMRHHDLQIGMFFHNAGEHQPHRRHADFDHPAEAEVKRAVVPVE